MATGGTVLLCTGPEFHIFTTTLLAFSCLHYLFSPTSLKYYVKIVIKSTFFIIITTFTRFINIIPSIKVYLMSYSLWSAMHELSLLLNYQVYM